MASMFPPETTINSADQLIIDRIRGLIGDPKELNRELGECAIPNIQEYEQVYELKEKGWPANVVVNRQEYNTGTNPTVSGYRYLVFNNFITDTTTSGDITYGMDVWYNTFRHSDREIIEAYDRCPIPPGLTSTTVTSECYILLTAIDILMGENWEDAIEDGAEIVDGDTRYNPSPGFDFREDLIGKLKKRLDDLIDSLMMGGITGVLID